MEDSALIDREPTFERHVFGAVLMGPRTNFKVRGGLGLSSAGRAAWTAVTTTYN